MKVKFTKMQVSHNGSALPYPLLFSVVGLVQGACLWWLLRTADTGSWLSGQPVAQTGLIFLAIAFPFAVYWTQQIEGLSLRARGIAVIVYALLFGFFGTYLRWASVLPSEKLVNQNLGLRPTELIAVSVLGFVSLSLFCGFDFAIKRWNYSKLFEYTWRNGILTFTAMVMTSSMWVVLFAGSMLMGLIKVTWVAELLKEPAFGYPMTGLVFAASVALGLHRASMIEAIRRFWLSISSWLLLLVLFFAVCWSIALPFSGLQSLFSTKNAALIMFWFAALADRKSVV